MAARSIPSAHDMKEIDLGKIKENVRRASETVENDHHFIRGIDGETVTFDYHLLNGKRVISIGDARNARFNIPSEADLGYRLIKIIIEESKNCVFDIYHNTISQHVEISHCENATFNLHAPLLTFQLDICRDISINYDKGCFIEGETKIIHAGIKKLKLSYDVYDYEVDDAISDEVHADLGPPDTVSELPIPEEIQFLTILTKKGFETERAVLKKGDLIPTPISEIDSEPELKSPRNNTFAGFVQQAYLIPRLVSKAFRSQLAQLRRQNQSN